MMHFTVFVTLLVVTFVADCGSFISAKTDVLDDHPYDHIEARRLRGDNKVQEERQPSNLSTIVKGLDQMDDIAAASTAKSLRSIKDFHSNFTPKQLKRLKNKSGLTLEDILNANAETINKLTQLAVIGAKRNKNVFQRTLEFTFIHLGMGALLYVIWAAFFKKPKTSSRSKKAGTTTVASA